MGKVSLFAVNSMPYCIIETEEDASILQEDLDQLQRCERDWQMRFNPDKCEVPRIANKRNII